MVREGMCCGVDLGIKLDGGLLTGGGRTAEGGPLRCPDGMSLAYWSTLSTLISLVGVRRSRVG